MTDYADKAEKAIASSQDAYASGTERNRSAVTAIAFAVLDLAAAVRGGRDD